MGGACNTYGEMSGTYRVMVGITEGRRPFGSLGVDWMIILRWISRKWNVEIWTGSIWLRIGTGGGHL